MSPRLPAAAAHVMDIARTLAAARPRGAASLEVASLLERGHAPGTSCELAFSVFFPDAAQGGPAAATLGASGYRIDGGPAPEGFLTVHHPVSLRVLDVAKALVRLERLAASHGGYVELVGAASSSAPEIARCAAEPITLGGTLRRERCAA